MSFTIQTQIVIFYLFMRGLYVVYVWLGQTSVNENTTDLEHVLYLCLALDWGCSEVLLPFTFTGRKMLTSTVDAHKKWITFIRHFRQLISEFWHTPSESQSLNKILHFLCAGRAWWYVWLGLQFCVFIKKWPFIIIKNIIWNEEQGADHYTYI